MIFKLKTEEILDGLAAMSHDPRYDYPLIWEFSFDANSLDHAKEVATAYAQDLISRWGDSKIFVHLQSLTQVELPCDEHYHYQELV